MTVAGFIDRVTPNQVSGWAFDDAQPDRPVTVEVFEDGQLIATAAATMSRADVGAVKAGAGYCGFDVPIQGKAPSKITCLANKQPITRANPSARAIDPASLAVAEAFAKSYGVSGDLDDRDFIFWYEDYVLPAERKGDAALNYMQGGRATAHIVGDTLHVHQPIQPNFRLLDFASGYGRVTRFFREVFPAADITACDIHPEAVAFIQHRLGAKAFKSDTNPQAFASPHPFEVIFALSFFTHMPRRTWGLWLNALASALAPGGLLIFSTHGLAIHKDLGEPPLDSDGFWFQAASEQKDLDQAEYGNTVTTFDYVYSQIKITDLQLEGYRAAGIGHHDLFILRSPVVHRA